MTYPDYFAWSATPPPGIVKFYTRVAIDVLGYFTQVGDTGVAFSGDTGDVLVGAEMDTLTQTTQIGSDLDTFVGDATVNMIGVE